MINVQLHKFYAGSYLKLAKACSERICVVAKPQLAGRLLVQ